MCIHLGTGVGTHYIVNTKRSWGLESQSFTHTLKHICLRMLSLVCIKCRVMPNATCLSYKYTFDKRKIAKKKIGKNPRDFVSNIVTICKRTRIFVLHIFIRIGVTVHDRNEMLLNEKHKWNTFIYDFNKLHSDANMPCSCDPQSMMHGRR